MRAEDKRQFCEDVVRDGQDFQDEGTHTHLIGSSV